jgi:hypothetical protein
VASLEDSLSQVGSIASEYRRAQALADLAPHLPKPLLPKALDLASTLRSHHWRDRALVALVPRLAALGQVEEALRQVGSMEEEACRADALSALAPYLPERLLPAARRLARAISGEAWRDRALAALDSAPQAPQSTANGPAVSDSDLVADLARARVIDREFERAQALAELAPGLAKLAPDLLWPHWQETLHLLAARTRRDLLADLRALQPVIVALGEAGGAADLVRAVEDVGRWWP